MLTGGVVRPFPGPSVGPSGPAEAPQPRSGPDPRCRDSTGRRDVSRQLRAEPARSRTGAGEGRTPAAADRVRHPGLVRNPEPGPVSPEAPITAPITLKAL